VRHKSAEDTSPVARKEGDEQLSGLGIAVFGVCEHVFIEPLDGVLESSELHHGVGDLSHPEGAQTLVESSVTFSRLDLVDAFPELEGELSSLGGLHAHF